MGSISLFKTVSVSISSVCRSIYERELEWIYFKELAHTAVEAGKFRFCRADEQPAGAGIR